MSADVYAWRCFGCWLSCPRDRCWCADCDALWAAARAYRDASLDMLPALVRDAHEEHRERTWSWRLSEEAALGVAMGVLLGIGLRVALARIEVERAGVADGVELAA